MFFSVTKDCRRFAGKSEKERIISDQFSVWEPRGGTHMKRLVAQLAVVIAALVMVVPASADDGQIAKKIIDKLNQHKQASSLRGFDLGVQVDKGTVTMMGQVASSEQAMLALDVARRDLEGARLQLEERVVTRAARLLDAHLGTKVQERGFGLFHVGLEPIDVDVHLT